MCEAEMIGAPGNVGDDTRSHRFVQRFQQLVGREVCQGGERVEGKLPAEYRGVDEQAVAVLREVAEAAGDDVANTLGNREPQRVRVKASLCSQQADDLSHEEGVSLRLLVDRDHELVPGRRAGGELAHPRDLPLPQPRPQCAGAGRGVRVAGAAPPGDWKHAQPSAGFNISDDTERAVGSRGSG